MMMIMIKEYLVLQCKTAQLQSMTTYLLSDVLSFGAFISENLFLIITSSPAHIAAALTSSSERPYYHRKDNKRWEGAQS